MGATGGPGSHRERHSPYRPRGRGPPLPAPPRHRCVLPNPVQRCKIRHTPTGLVPTWFLHRPNTQTPRSSSLTSAPGSPGSARTLSRTHPAPARPAPSRPALNDLYLRSPPSGRVLPYRTHQTAARTGHSHDVAQGFRRKAGVVTPTTRAPRPLLTGPALTGPHSRASHPHTAPLRALQRAATLSRNSSSVQRHSPTVASTPRPCSPNPPSHGSGVHRPALTRPHVPHTTLCQPSGRSGMQSR